MRFCIDHLWLHNKLLQNSDLNQQAFISSVLVGQELPKWLWLTVSHGVVFKLPAKDTVI